MNRTHDSYSLHLYYLLVREGPSRRGRESRRPQIGFILPPPPPPATVAFNSDGPMIAVTAVLQLREGRASHERG